MSYRGAWRGWLVVSLLLAAALACSVAFSTAHFENVKLYKTPDREGMVARTFAPDEAFICLTDFVDAPEPLAIEAVWSRLDEAGQWVTVASEALEAATGPLTFIATPPADGWEAGTYRVELRIEGDGKAVVEFKVR